MEDYKQRMIDEYRALKDKHQRLHNMLVKNDAGKLDFTLTCPVPLLKHQEEVMYEYLRILEIRALLENIELSNSKNATLEPKVLNIKAETLSPAPSALEEAGAITTIDGEIIGGTLQDYLLSQPKEIRLRMGK